VAARLFVISGPSGVGKGTVIRAVRERLPWLALATSATTRPIRPGERDGREYYFLSPQAFEEAVGKGEFLEHVDYAGHRYGTLRREVERRLRSGESVVLEIDVEGAREVKRLLPHAVLVFIAPPTVADLETRLRHRETNSPAEIETRLAIACAELGAARHFDHRITNDDVSRAAEELERTIRSAVERRAAVDEENP
jgi:guanylate kinase